MNLLDKYLLPLDCPMDYFAVGDAELIYHLVLDIQSLNIIRTDSFDYYLFFLFCFFPIK